MFSLARGVVLPEEPYLIRHNMGGPRNYPAVPARSENVPAHPSNNADRSDIAKTVEDFFQQSRLSLIGQMAKEAQAWVGEWRANEAEHKFPSRSRLPAAENENA